MVTKPSARLLELVLVSTLPLSISGPEGDLLKPSAPRIPVVVALHAQNTKLGGRACAMSLQI